MLPRYVSDLGLYQVFLALKSMGVDLCTKKIWKQSMNGFVYWVWHYSELEEVTLWP